MSHEAAEWTHMNQPVSISAEQRVCSSVTANNISYRKTCGSLWEHRNRYPTLPVTYFLQSHLLSIVQTLLVEFSTLPCFWKELSRHMLICEKNGLYSTTVEKKYDLEYEWKQDAADEFIKKRNDCNLHILLYNKRVRSPINTCLKTPIHYGLCAEGLH
jgi:hypothetical protein